MVKIAAIRKKGFNPKDAREHIGPERTPKAPLKNDNPNILIAISIPTVRQCCE